MEINQTQAKSNEEIAKLIEEKNYDDAEKELLQIIEKKKENYQTHFLLGNVYALLKQQEKAIKNIIKNKDKYSWKSYVEQWLDFVQ